MRTTGKCVDCGRRTSGRTDNQFLCRACRQVREYAQRVAAIERMNPFDLGWLAGLIEGEGCFYCKKPTSGIYQYAGFTLASTDWDVMDRFANLLGLALRGPYYVEQKRKSLWSVQTTGNKAMAIMAGFYDQLSIRRKEQIDKARAFNAKE